MSQSDLPATPPSAPIIPDIIQRYINGESIQSIAAEHRACRQTIYHWMLAEIGPQYDQMITRVLINRIADADQLLESGASMLDIARARDQAKFARMDFERRRPKLYGPRQELDVDNRITITVNRLPAAVTPYIDASPSIIPVDSQVVDNQGKDKKQELT